MLAHSKNWKFLGEVFVSKIIELNKIQSCQNALVTVKNNYEIKNREKN